MRLGFLAALPAWLFVASPASAEDIAIRGAFHHVVLSNLGRMTDTMNAIGLKDGHPTGLHLHVRALLEPGDHQPEDAHIFLDAKQGHVSLFPRGDNEIVLPTDPALQAENPNVVAALSKGQEIRFQATVSLVQNNGDKPYNFSFQPRVYPAEAVFVSTKPIAAMTMIFPVPFTPWKRTD